MSRSCSIARFVSARIVWAALLMAPAASGYAAEEIGKAERIEKQVNATLEATARQLAVPDTVHRNEQIATREKAAAHLRFKDETDLRLGPEATIKLDVFVYSGEKNAAMELAKGAMRFASGNGPKGSYLIRTPVATIGLRGTVVEVTVRQGRTYVSLHEGAAEVCTRSGRCMELKEICTYLSVDARGVTLPLPLNRRVPIYSTQCSGDFCVADRCTPRLQGASGAIPPAVTPPRIKPPKKQPPKGRNRQRRAERMIVEEEIIDEPVYTRPRVSIGIPGLILPGLIGPGRGRYPGGTRNPGITGPKSTIPGSRRLF